MPAPTTHDQITEFESKAASLLAGFAAEASLSKSGLEDNLRYIGVSAKVTATGTAVKVEVQVPEHPGFKADESPEDFTEAARNRRAGKYLADRKAAVWKAVKAMSITPEQKVEALRALGYAEKNLPSQKTRVSADVFGSGKYNPVEFTLNGEHTTEEVLDRLEAVADSTPAVTMALAAFPEAVLQDGNGKVRHLLVSTQLTWPARYTA